MVNPVGMKGANRRHHIFGFPKHNLDRLVRQYGSEQAAAEAIEAAVDTAFADGRLIIDHRGLYKQVFEVDGNLVNVSGRVIDGVVRIGTAWITP
jgi:hypothetical protein